MEDLQLIEANQEWMGWSYVAMAASLMASLNVG